MRGSGRIGLFENGTEGSTLENRASGGNSVDGNGGILGKRHWGRYWRPCNSAHRNAINDFGMTSPKGVARSFAGYAHGQPEADYHVMHFAQLPGTTKRSTECREGTEQLYHSKKLLVPMAFFAWHELPIAVGSYVLTGRFNPEH